MPSAAAYQVGGMVPFLRMRTQEVRLNSDQWWAAVDSNHLPPRYQHGALPVELAAPGWMAGAEGFEPSALGFGDRCSNQTELRPCDQRLSLPAAARLQAPHRRVAAAAGGHQQTGARAHRGRPGPRLAQGADGHRGHPAREAEHVEDGSLPTLGRGPRADDLREVPVARRMQDRAVR